MESISGVIDTSTGSVSLRAAFPNPNGLLHSGGAGNIILPSIYKDCIAVPQAATFELQDKVYVYKVVDGKAASVMIDVEKISNGPRVYSTRGTRAGRRDRCRRRGAAARRHAHRSEGSPQQPLPQLPQPTSPPLKPKPRRRNNL